MKLSILFAMSLLLLIPTGCSDDTSPTVPRIEISIAPATGTPAQKIKIIGINPSQYLPGELTITIGNQPAPIIAGFDGALWTAIPLFLDPETGLSRPPATPVDVEVLKNGTTLDKLPTALTVQPLPEANGTLDKIRLDLDRTREALLQLPGIADLPVGVSDQFTSALIGALEDLVQSDDPRSLASVMSQLSPQDKELFDAICSASGMAQQVAAFADLMEALSAESGARRGEKRIGDIDDLALAWRMQFYAIFSAFTQQVVSETVSSFSLLSGLVGLVPIPGLGPLLAVTQAILTVVDYTLNKLILAAIPARVSALELSLYGTILEPGEVTDSNVFLQAQNIPASLSLGDMVNLALTRLGLESALTGAPARIFQDHLGNVLVFVTGQIQSRVTAYAAANPGADVLLDWDLGIGIPVLTWQTEVMHRELVNLVSDDPGIVVPLPDEINWQAVEGSTGEANLSVSPATGPGAIVVTLPSWLDYFGGAFGNDLPVSLAVTVRVSKPLVLEVVAPSTVPPEGTFIVQARVGYEQPDGSVIWTAGIPVDFQAVDGAVDPVNDISDTDGYARAQITASPQVESVVVTVSAEGIDDTYAEETLEVEVGFATLRIELPCLGEGSASVNCETPDSDGDMILMPGEAGVSYNVKISIKGLVEQKTYSGSTASDGMWAVGGIADGSSFNIFSLQISSPLQVYYLNSGSSFIDRCWVVDFQKTLVIDAGALITLYGDAGGDALGTINRDNNGAPIVVEGVPPYPQAFSGQFVQVDLVSRLPRP